MYASLQIVNTTLHFRVIIENSIFTVTSEHYWHTGEYQFILLLRIKDKRICYVDNAMIYIIFQELD